MVATSGADLTDIWRKAVIDYSHVVNVSVDSLKDPKRTYDVSKEKWDKYISSKRVDGPNKAARTISFILSKFDILDAAFGLAAAVLLPSIFIGM